MSSPSPLAAFHHALQLFAAAFGALTLAVLLDLHNPFWAAMPVWVVSQAFREDLLIRAVLRILGTVLGAGIAFGALTLTDSAALQVAVLALSVGGATATAFWIGTIYSYGAVLTAITVSVVILPVFIHTGMPPDEVQQLALDRVLCTLIGVACVTLATFPFTPPRASPHPLRLDHGYKTALRNGLIASLAAAIGGLIALATGAVMSLAGALSLAIFATLLGSAADPRPMLANMVRGSALGAIAGLAYRAIEVGLSLEGIEALILVAPFIALGAWVRANPRTAPLGLDYNMVFLLAAEVGTAGHPLGAQAISALALVAAAMVMVTIHRRLLVLRPALGTSA